MGKEISRDGHEIQSMVVILETIEETVFDGLGHRSWIQKLICLPYQATSLSIEANPIVEPLRSLVTMDLRAVFLKTGSGRKFAFSDMDVELVAA